jgi:hypothetical protein
MARPLRIEFAGAAYHITSRGDRREAIFGYDQDRERFLGVLAAVGERYSWVCHASCLIDQPRPPRGRDGRRESLAGHAAVERCLHACIGLTPGPRWPPVSGAVQRHPGREGRVSARVDSVCRPEPGAGGEGRCAEALALEQPSGDDSRGAATDLVGGGRATLSPFGASREAVRRRYRSFAHEGSGESIWQGLRQRIPRRRSVRDTPSRGIRKWSRLR